ncbi:MAG: arginine--tRNA ligase [Actinomycetales bacterium]|nr:arginine--tRNA ligase [Actinomycetales bacterium]
MTPGQLEALIRASLTQLGLPTAPDSISAILPEVSVERPRRPEHGDYATSIALVAAGRLGVAPRALAADLARALAADPGIAAAEVAGPGFVNIRLAPAAAGAVARTIVEDGADYGTSTTLAGRHINLEFISANPTGPLHLGHTRWAALGDAIGRVLTAAGATVTREFYINDRGVQLDRFGESLLAVAEGRPVPDDGYHGAYIVDIAAAILAEHPQLLHLPAAERLELAREEGYRMVLTDQQRVLALFRTTFDMWCSERALHESGAVERALDRLRDAGHVYTLEGAQWLRTTDVGDDKDRVLVKADGELTYFAADTAYYLDKRARGHDLLIYLLGADHHGYAGRLRAVAACAGDDPDRTLEVLIGQLVRIEQDGAEVRLSKRAGTVVTLEALIDEVGVDAARYSLIRHPADTPLTLDLDLLRTHTSDNPVFSVQYAHARIAGVLRNAERAGIHWRAADFDPGVLVAEQETRLLGACAQYPRVVATAAELRAPHRVARHLEQLATDFHRFYDACRVLPAGEAATPVHIGRLWLSAATRQVLANGLALCGVNAPDQM